MIVAEVSSGRSDFDSSSPTKPETPGSAAAVDGLDRRRRAACAGRLEGRGAHGDDVLAVLRAHGLDRIAGVDRPLERVGRDNLGHFRNLHHVEESGDPRHDIFSRRGRRRHDGLVGRRQSDDQRGDRLRQHMRVRFGVGDEHLGDAVELRRGFGHCFAIMPGDQDVHLGAKRLGGGQRLVGRVLERRIVVLGEKKCRHQIAPASFLSLSTSSATDFTLTPALRTGGSAVLTTSSRGAMSTP